MFFEVVGVLPVFNSLSLLQRVCCFDREHHLMMKSGGSGFLNSSWRVIKSEHYTHKCVNTLERPMVIFKWHPKCSVVDYM